MDFVKDQNPKPVYLAAELVEMPFYVKEAQQILPEEVEVLSDAAFAEPGSREFPLHSKAATWLSAAYGLGSGHWQQTPQFETRILKAASVHNIVEDILSLVEGFSTSLTKQASHHQPRFALAVDFGGMGGMGMEQFYAIDNPVQIVKSARDMVNDYQDGRLRIEFLKPAAEELIKAAEDTGTPLEDICPQVLAFGDERLPDFDNALQVAGLRKNAGVPDEAVELYKEAVEGARQEPEQTPKWMGLWLDMDSIYNVKYSAHQPDPYSAFYAGTPVKELEKAASNMVVISDVMIPASVVAMVPDDDILRNFRKEAADQIISAKNTAADNAPASSQQFQDLNEQLQKAFLNLLLKQE